jgi:hypothetical protein
MFGLLAGCGRADNSTSGSPRTDLRGLIEDVTQSTARKYALTDDRGNVMDTAKVIAVPEAGGFVGLYHSYRPGPAIFSVHLATSSDLLNWTWRVQLADQASQPTIKPASDGGYVVAWEQEPDNHLKFAHYPGWADLLKGVPARTFDAPQRLSDCAEGTPNLYMASTTFLDVGFHFYDGCDLDRQARGTTDWTSWNATAEPRLEETVRVHGVMGGIGDRDVISFDGSEFTLIEGQVVKGDWRTWRVFLHDGETGRAEQLSFRTHAGSVAFTNPTIEQIEIGGRQAILMSLFVPQEGAAGAEAGQLIYYRTFGPVDQ